jgi:hypothetical protein
LRVKGVGNRGKGRVKGTPNKTTGALKDMILEALNRAGGVSYLERQAEAEPKSFMLLLGRVLPLQVTGSEGGPILIITGVDRGDNPA